MIGQNHGSAKRRLAKLVISRLAQSRIQLTAFGIPLERETVFAVIPSGIELIVLADVFVVSLIAGVRKKMAELAFAIFCALPSIIAPTLAVLRQRLPISVFRPTLARILLKLRRFLVAALRVNRIHGPRANLDAGKGEALKKRFVVKLAGAGNHGGKE